MYDRGLPAQAECVDPSLIRAHGTDHADTESIAPAATYTSNNIIVTWYATTPPTVTPTTWSAGTIQSASACEPLSLWSRLPGALRARIRRHSLTRPTASQMPRPSRLSRRTGRRSSPPPPCPEQVPGTRPSRSPRPANGASCSESPSSEVSSAPWRSFEAPCLFSLPLMSSPSRRSSLRPLSRASLCCLCLSRI